MPAMRWHVGFNELKSQEPAFVFVPIFDWPTFGVALGNFDGPGFLYEVLSLGREPAFEYTHLERPEKPIGVRNYYLRKRSTCVPAKIQRCPAHFKVT